MKNPLLPFVLVSAVLLYACGGSKTENATEQDSTAKTATSEPVVTKPSGDVVCVWEGVPVYTEANKKSKWMTGISLGETVKYLNEDATDAADNNREYIKVELFDGKTGWAPTYGLVRNAKLGAVVRELSTVYKRPQLAAISGNKLKMMEIVAVGKQEQNFVEVTSAKKAITGWVHTEDLTTNEDDVTAALLAIKMIPADATGEVLISKLKEYLDAAPAGSPFYNRLNDQYNALMSEQIEQSETAPSDTVVN